MYAYVNWRLFKAWYPHANKTWPKCRSANNNGSLTSFDYLKGEIHMHAGETWPMCWSVQTHYNEPFKKR